MIYFVATPIGNLKDITLRALDTLKAADVVFCEDTRHTLKLLTTYGLKKPLLSCHKFNEREAAEKMISLAREGKEVAVVSDAGMPAVSDPGYEVCRALREAGVAYTVLPGANAALCALVLSALPSRTFVFLGFLPEKRGERLALLERYAAARDTLVIHCAPQDLDAQIADMGSVFGDRRACAVREITKIYEESIPFTLCAGLGGEKRGEYVLVVEGAGERENPLCGLSPQEHVKAYTDGGMDRKEAIKLAARDRGVAKSELYKQLLDR